jgi:hypothetical protein
LSAPGFEQVITVSRINAQVTTVSATGFLLYLDNLFDFGKFSLKKLFDPHPEGHFGHRSACAVPDKLYFNRPVRDVYQFNITAVSHKRGTYLVQDTFDLLFIHQVPSCLPISEILPHA